jgi:hypothetical protein
MNTKIYKSLLTAGLLAGTTSLVAGFTFDEEILEHDAVKLDIKLNYADLEETVVAAEELVIDMTPDNFEFVSLDSEITAAGNRQTPKDRLFWKGKIGLCHNSILSAGLNGHRLKLNMHERYVSGDNNGAAGYEHQLITQPSDAEDHLFNIDGAGATLEARKVLISIEDSSYDGMYNDSLGSMTSTVLKDTAKGIVAQDPEVDNVGANNDDAVERNDILFGGILSEIQPMGSDKADCSEMVVV